MRRSMVLFVVLVSCSQEVFEKPVCPVLSVLSGSGCCQDLDETGVCDVDDPVVRASVAELPVQNAPRRAEVVVVRRPTVITAALEKFEKSSFSYSYVLDGASVVVLEFLELRAT